MKPENFYTQINRIGLMVTGDVKSPQIVGIEQLKTGPLVVMNLKGEKLFQADAPAEGWNFENVTKAIAHLDTSNGAEISVDSIFIGSTEL
jgi:hypothetical protein